MTDAVLRKIIHVDMDAFYASVEQRDHPEWRGKPLAVGTAAKRGVVAAASYEARVFGVRSAMPSVTALRKCPDLIFAPVRFDVYRAVSKQIHAIFADYTNLIEPLSLDEAYLDVTANRRKFATAADTAQEIRRRIHEETGLTASAGVSYNKFLAKLGSDMRKPNGQFVIAPERGADFIAQLAVKKFHGVGPVTAAKLNRLGIETGADLKNQSLAFLEWHFGKSGAWFYQIARGEDHRPVNPHRLRKSCGAETTFHEDLTAPSEIEARLMTMADEVWDWCQTHQRFGMTATIKLKFTDFRTITRSRTLLRRIDSAALLQATCRSLLCAALPLPLGVRLVGVSVANFQDRAPDAAGAAQLGLAL